MWSVHSFIVIPRHILSAGSVINRQSTQWAAETILTTFIGLEEEVANVVATPNDWEIPVITHSETTGKVFA